MQMKQLSKRVCLCVCDLQMLLSDFSHHHIEMACTLLETCGRFLFRSPESHLRTSVLLVRHIHAHTFSFVLVCNGSEFYAVHNK